MTYPRAPRRRKWLGETGLRTAQIADKYRAELIARYGEARGKAVTAAEVFEGSEYGSPPPYHENKDILFPF